jgi:L-seryl-tRNA(Ser) seleniumtransferase
MNANPFRQLPSVHEILENESVQQLAPEYGHEEIVAVVRHELMDLRARLAEGGVGDGSHSAEAVAERVVTRVRRDFESKLQPVINATGIVLHTNLGRAPMAEEAAQAAYQAARGYLNLEMDLESGQRSSRQAPIRASVCRLTGAESATAVNNNAAATVIVLRALCKGREVIVSRGQLIEIGGSFRIPDIMAVSGASLREVGTTNITRLADYEAAIGPNTGALMHIHTSNYRISGFTRSASVAELAALGKSRGLAVIDDIGSGALVDFSRFGFSGEPIARESIAAGADLVLFSGDKLLGGPQAGIIAGRKDLIQRIEKDPLMRAFRLDKMTLAALEATLRLYRNEDVARRQVTLLRMLGASLDELQRRAESLCSRLAAIEGLTCQATADEAYVGGGSLPDQIMKTWVVEVQADDLSDAELALRLRTGAPAIVGRVRDGKLILDMRTVFVDQHDALVEALRRAVHG